MTESQVQNQILQYLISMGYFVWRNNNTPIFDPVRKRYRAMPKFSRKGVPDILGLLPGGRFLAIEVKKPVKNPRSFEKLHNLASQDQKLFINQVNDLGGLAFVADSLEVVKRQLQLA